MKNKLFSALTILSLAVFALPFSASADFASVEITRYQIKVSGQSSYSNNISVSVGDRVDFAITIANSSSVQARNLALNVYLPHSLTLTSNSIAINNDRYNGNSTTGIFLGHLSANSTINISFTATANENLSGRYNIYANLSGDNFFSANKIVSVSGGGTTNNNNNSSNNNNSNSPTPTPTPNGQYISIAINSLGKNLTKGDTVWTKNVQAESGDLLQFSLMVIANGNLTVTNALARSRLDQGLEFVPNSVTIDDVNSSESLLLADLYLGDIQPGRSKHIKFQARVGSKGFNQPQTLLSNVAQAKGDYAPTSTNISGVNVVLKNLQTPSPTPSPNNVKNGNGQNGSKTPANKIVYLQPSVLDIVKVAKNITQDQEVATAQINAKPGDEIEFYIQISNPGAYTAERVAVRDSLPKNLDYIFNSARMGGESISDEIVRNGFALESLSPRQVKIITYRTRVLPAKDFDKDEPVFKNLTEAKAINAQTAKDSVEILVRNGFSGLLGGSVLFGSFGLTIIIMLIVLIILLLTFLIKEKRRNGKSKPWQS